MISRFQVVPAAYIYLLRGEGEAAEVLLQRRQNTGYRDGHWACAAAGHVELGEPAERAAIREANEELGIEISLADLAPLTAMHRTHGNDQPIDERVDFFYTCRRFTGEPRLMEPGKASDLGWFPLTTLPSPIVPHEEWVLTRLAGAGLPAITSFGFVAE